MNNKKQKKSKAKKKIKSNNSALRVAVAILSGDSICADTTTSITEMFMYSMMQGLSMRWINPRVSRIETGRNMAIDQLYDPSPPIDDPYYTVDPLDDYVLFIDSDMVIPRDVIPRLMERNVEIVGVNCPKRGIPFTAVYTHDIDGKWMSFQDGGIHEMDYIGMACTLIKTSILKKFRRPIFYAQFSEQNMITPIGEDICFSRAAREAGIKVYCDMDVSMNIGHIITHPLYLPKDYTEDMHKERLKV